MTDLPHFALPFRFGLPHVAVTEQDSIDEIGDCVLAVLSCPLGYRVELPDFGVADPTFSTPSVDLDSLRESVELWEPRAVVALEQAMDFYDVLITRVQAEVRVRTEE